MEEVKQEQEQEIFISQAEAARKLSELRGRKYSRSYVNKLARLGKIQRNGSKVSFNDLVSLKPEKVGRKPLFKNETRDTV